MRFLLLSLPLLVFLLANAAAPATPPPPKALLSEYGFFKGRLADLNPEQRVFPYEVNAPLFTDYAEKARFVYLPEGTTLQYDSTLSFAFPTGAVIIKNFYYWHQAAQPEQGRRILETRLLLKDAKGWKALTYIWNEAQTDAALEVAGATLPVAWTDAAQKKRQIEYVVPNQNQCKGCHSYDGAFTPIGTTARQLNRANQLQQWVERGYLSVPDTNWLRHAPQLTDYRTANAPLDKAARAYLDGNCAHCHNPHGPASTSGMFLGVEERDMERLGVGKPPVAAGRGSGNRKFGIVPGKPDQSILLYRIESNDPGIRMPELGRSVAHAEGVELLRKWILMME